MNCHNIHLIDFFVAFVLA